MSDSAAELVHAAFGDGAEMAAYWRAKRAYNLARFFEGVFSARNPR